MFLGRAQGTSAKIPVNSKSMTKDRFTLLCQERVFEWIKGQNLLQKPFGYKDVWEQVYDRVIKQEFYV